MEIANIRIKIGNFKFKKSNMTKGLFAVKQRVPYKEADGMLNVYGRIFNVNIQLCSSSEEAEDPRRAGPRKRATRGRVSKGVFVNH